MKGLGSARDTVSSLVRRYECLTASSSSQSHTKPIVTLGQVRNKESSYRKSCGSNVGSKRKASQPTHEERWGKLVASLGSLTKDAVALSTVDHFVKQGQGQLDYNYYQAVEKFTLHYRDILDGDGLPTNPEEIDMDVMENTYDVLSFFCKAYLEGHSQRVETAREATEIEQQRVLRALYRRDIFMRLYYAGGTDRDHADREAYLRDFYNRKLGQVLTRAWAREDTRVFNGRLLYLFEPWELEQIVAADLFLARTVYDHVQLRKQHEVASSQAQVDDLRSLPSAVFLTGPIVRLMCDLDFLRRAELGLMNVLKT